MLVGAIHLDNPDLLDRNEAIRWIRLAAENGDGYAQSFLARELAPDWWVVENDLPSGLKIKPDHAEARKWAELAASQNQADAHVVLACLHESERRPELAVTHINKAVKLGSATALALKSRWLIEGKLYKPDKVEGFRLALLAAETDSRYADVWLGALYNDGLVPPDYRKERDRGEAKHHALYYYTRAAKNGSNKGREFLGDLAADIAAHEKKFKKKPVWWDYFVRDYPDSVKEFYRQSALLKKATPVKP